MRTYLLGLLLSLAVLGGAEKTLVVLDNWATIETHSVFFEALRMRGQDLEFQMITPTPKIKYYDEYFYDNIILMAPGAKGNHFKQTFQNYQPLSTSVGCLGSLNPVGTSWFSRALKPGSP